MYFQFSGMSDSISYDWLSGAMHDMYDDIKEDKPLVHSFVYINPSQKAFMWIGTILGIPANVIVIIISILQFKASTSEMAQTCFVLNMALADLLSLVGGASFLLEYYINSFHKWTQSVSIRNFYCKFIYCGPTIFLTSYRGHTFETPFLFFQNSDRFCQPSLSLLMLHSIDNAF